MSDFRIALEKTLDSEGGFAHVEETGEVVNRGITAQFLRSIGVLHGSGPATVQEIDFVQKMTLEYTENLYLNYFWNPGHFGFLNSQQIANKVFDLSVNCGLETGIMFLQKAYNWGYPTIAMPLKIDGLCGPKTQAAINGARVGIIYIYLLDAARAYYITKNPKNIPMWLDRLGRV